MSKRAGSTETSTPIVLEEDGEVSLHFAFPTIQSRMRKTDPDRLLLDYTRTMMGFLLFVPHPGRIAMVGLGGGSLAKYCYRRLPQTEFTAVEVSPQVIALREEFRIPDDDARFRVVCADGADFVHSLEASLDVLLIDGFDAEGQPARLCSSAFYDDCRGALRDGGILVVNLCADDADCARHLARIGASFAGRTLVVDAEDGDNKIVFAGAGTRFPPNFGEVTARLAALEGWHPVDLDRTAQKIIASRQRAGGRLPGAALKTRGPGRPKRS
jgi:spermidine synthase